MRACVAARWRACIADPAAGRTELERGFSCAGRRVGEHKPATLLSEGMYATHIDRWLGGGADLVA